MTKYIPQDDNPIQEQDRTQPHPTNASRGIVDPSGSGWSWGQGRRSGWMWKTIFEYLNSNLWQGTDPPEGSALAMTWRGQWRSGPPYTPGAVVVDGRWTMIALRETTDKPAPVLAGSPVWVLPDVPTWTFPEPVTSLVITGARFSGGNIADMILSGRFWIPEIGADIDYRIILREEVSAGVYFDFISEDIMPVGTGWHEEPTQGFVLDPDKIYELLLIASNSATTTDFNGAWNFESGTANYSPVAGEIYHRTSGNQLRVNEIDNDLTDHNVDLLSVVAGTQIEFANGAIFTVDNVGIHSRPVFDFYGNFTGYPAGEVQSITFRVPTPTATQYAEMVGWWTSNPPPDGTVEGVFSAYGDPLAYNDNGYGVDLLFDEVTFSPDWDIVALSDDLTP